MGFILKIVIFAVAAYGIWTTANRWFNILGGNRRTPAPPPPQNPPQSANRPQGPRENPVPRPRIVEDTHPCPGCGTYIAVGQAKCGRPECPQT
ncbi:MAG: hypothetical protein JSR24_10365 [Proteobacteria bacterium]|nr:hypothetical protein [Pseudomonadota bacterium]